MDRIPDTARRVLAWTLAAMLGMAMVPAQAAVVIPGTTTRVSVGASGVEADDHSGACAISGDGRFIAFQSDASNLVAGDTNDTTDVFVRDRDSNTVVRITNERGGQGPSISEDGRFIAFESLDPSLVTSDTNDTWDVFVHDRVLNTTSLATVDAAGAQFTGAGRSPSISADGRLVAFTVSSDGGRLGRIFVRDLEASATNLVSVDSAGALPTRGASAYPAISADGGAVAFWSDSPLVVTDTNAVGDVFVRDLAPIPATTRVSVDSSGAQANGESVHPSISADGRLVAFVSVASDLVDGDNNGVPDAFVRDRVAGSTVRVSVDSSGQQGNAGCLDDQGPALSADGRFVAFCSAATNMVSGDGNDVPDIFVRDRTDDVTTRVSVGTGGVQAALDSFFPAISADGFYVAFDSNAPLVADDVNDFADVFVNDWQRFASAVAISSGPKSSLSYGGSFAVSGLLSGGGPLSGRRVALQSAPAATGPFTDTSLEVTTTAAGAFAFSVKPAILTYYRVRFAGDAGSGVSFSSGSLYAKPMAYVYQPVAPSTMYRSRAATVYGYVKPSHSSGTLDLRFYLKNSRGTYAYHHTVKAKFSSSSSTRTKYSAKLSLPHRGRWRVRSHHSDTGHAAAYSSYDYITVR